MTEQQLVEELRGVFDRAPDRSWHLTELLSLAHAEPGRLKVLKAALTVLLHDGTIARAGGQRFRATKGQTVVRGRIDIDRDGRMSLLIDGSEDILEVDPRGAQWVAQGEHVEARLIRGRGTRLHAEVISVIVDPDARDLGVFRRVGTSSFVEPEPRRGRPFAGHAALVETLPEPAPIDGQLVEFRIVSGRTPNRAAIAEITRILGTPGDRNTEILRLFLENDLPTQFPEAVEAEVSGLQEPTEAEKTSDGRVDLRGLALVTIDGETARDFDDAVCAQPHPRGFRVHVAIADVAYYVRRGTALDTEAARRGTSTYLTDRVVPMLPERLSNDLCSLRPHLDRLCFVSDMVIDYEGEIVESKIYRGVMCSRARLTYTRVAKALAGEPDAEIAPLCPMLDVLADAADTLYKRRVRRGAIDLDLAEPEMRFDENNLPTDVKPRERNRAHRLIEDLMLAANMAIATFCAEKDLPTLYRVHDRPDPDKLVNFIGVAAELGFFVGDALLRKQPREAPKGRRSREPKSTRLQVGPSDVADIAQEITRSGGSSVLHGQLLRCMAQARYDVMNDGHFGLAAPRYLHFTSPIRRYPDLMVHRLLGMHFGHTPESQAPKYALEELASIAETSSKCERKAMSAERSSMDLDRAYIAAKHVGKVLPGRITGVQGFGLFVAIDDPFVEGLIPIATLAQDFFLISDTGAFLMGQHTGLRFALGDTLRVEIADVDFVKRQVELRLAESPAVTRRTPRRRSDESPDARGRPRLAPQARSRPDDAQGRPDKRPHGRAQEKSSKKPSRKNPTRRR